MKTAGEKGSVAPNKSLLLVVGLASHGASKEAKESVPLSLFMFVLFCPPATPGLLPCTSFGGGFSLNVVVVPAAKEV
jgi:hypothetical protein